MKKFIGTITAKYALVQAAYWMSSCIISSYASVYLLGEGFSNTQIGVLIGLAGAISTVMQPWVGGMVDKSERISLRSMCLIFGLAMAGLASVLAVIHIKGVIAVVYSTLRVLFQVALPLVCAMGMESINRGSSLNFGLGRGIGSIAYAVLTSVVGVIVAAMGSHILTVGMVLTSLLFVLGIRLFPKEQNLPYEPEAMKEMSAPGRAFFSRYPKFFLHIVGWTFVFTGYGLISNFLFQIIESKGGDSASMGIALAIAALSEVPTMFLFVEMVRKLKSGTWLKISSVFFVMKVLGVFVFSSMAGIYVAHAFQMLGYALFSVASVYYINCLMEEHDKVRGQAYMTMTSTMGAVIGSTAGGAIIDIFGIQAMLMIAVGTAAAGAVLVFRTAKSNI